MKLIKTIALIPALNPDDNLIYLTENLKKNKFDVIVVNDGSSEEYDKIFKKIKCNKLLIHEINKGKGFALKTGLSYIKENYDNDYIVVTLDADGQHTIRDALKVVEYNKKHLDTLVLGSRLLDKNVPLKSKVGNAITRNIFRLSTGVKIYDTQTGLRSFSNKLIDKMISIKGERYEYEINVLLEFASNKAPIKEITIKTIYIDNNSSSHFNPIIDSFKIYKEIIKFSLSSLLSFIIDFILYSVFLYMLKSNKYAVQLSNVFARIISASINYSVNKKIVFNYDENGKNTLLYYALLAVAILLLNTCILTMLVYFGIPKLISKIITEIILFILSYTVQNKYIFRSDNN